MVLFEAIVIFGNKPLWKINVFFARLATCTMLVCAFNGWCYNCTNNQSLRCFHEVFVEMRFGMFLVLLSLILRFCLFFFRCGRFSIWDVSFSIPHAMRKSLSETSRCCLFCGQSLFLGEWFWQTRRSRGFADEPEVLRENAGSCGESRTGIIAQWELVNLEKLRCRKWIVSCVCICLERVLLCVSRNLWWKPIIDFGDRQTLHKTM